MDYKDLKALSDGMMDDEAGVMMRILELRSPQCLDAFVDEAKGRPSCPRCGSAMQGHGRPNGHRRWRCPSCGATAMSCSEGPAEYAKSKAATWLRFIDCELHRMTIREAAAKCGISVPQAFFLRQKMQEAMGETLGRAELSGRVELDGKSFRINLKGTRPEYMPRASKHRGSGSTETGHKVMTLWAIDENDNMVARIVGLGQESRGKADQMLPYLKGCKTLVTDDKSCYEGFAKDNGFKHVQVKSKTFSNLQGETMNEVNSLMSDFDTWSCRCRGISTRHLQGYLDRFLFQKLLCYAKEAMDRPGAQLRAILSSAAVINCNEILTKAMPVDLYEAYGKWGYGIFAKGKTHS